MAEDKDSKDTQPLLMEGLSTPERVMLGQVTHHGGFKVIIKLLDAACTRATKDAVKLDPEKPDYEKKLAVRTQRTRNFSEVSSMLMKSIEWHIGEVKAEDDKENQEAVDAVAKTFGIHTVPPKPKK